MRLNSTRHVLVRSHDVIDVHPGPLFLQLGYLFRTEPRKGRSRRGMPPRLNYAVPHSCSCLLLLLFFVLIILIIIVKMVEQAQPKPKESHP